MKTFITSDLHFGHKNIMSFCSVTRARFKNDVDYMNETMTREWNEIVSPGDLTYILGDVAFLPAQAAVAYMRRLNGRKILVAGNHDEKLLKDPRFRACFEEIHNYLEINYDGNHIVMCHYPFAEWNRMHRGAINFHGHLHGNPSGMEQYRSVDVAMDAQNGYIVTLMEDAIRKALKGEIKSHH